MDVSENLGLTIVISPLETSYPQEEVPMSLEWLNCTLVFHTRKSQGL
jgi:hypothetical protein